MDHAQHAGADVVLAARKFLLVVPLYTAGLTCLPSEFARAQAEDSPVITKDAELALGSYREETRDSVLTSFGTSATGKMLFDGEGKATSVRLGGTFKRICFTDSEDPLSKDQLDGADRLEENSLSASIDQGLQVGRQIGAVVGRTNSPLGQTRWAGVKVGEWWLLETLQTVVDFRRTISEVRALDVTDTDGARIQTPAVLDGTSLSLNVTNFTTPSTILMAGYSRTRRSDRPDAWSMTGEIRQFVDATNSALHLAVGHYENIGTVRQVSLQGQIVANSVRAEWHQRLRERWIIVPGYRWYLETENPRAEGAANSEVGTDSIYLNVRWRYRTDMMWVADQPEIYGFFGRYTTSEPRTVVYGGLGTRMLW